MPSDRSSTDVEVLVTAETPEPEEVKSEPNETEDSSSFALSVSVPSAPPLASSVGVNTRRSSQAGVRAAAIQSQPLCEIATEGLEGPLVIDSPKCNILLKKGCLLATGCLGWASLYHSVFELVAAYWLYWKA